MSGEKKVEVIMRMSALIFVSQVHKNQKHLSWPEGSLTGLAHVVTLSYLMQ